MFLPHLEIRRGDLSLFLRVGDRYVDAGATPLHAFVGKTPVALLSGSAGEAGWSLRPVGEAVCTSAEADLLAALNAWADRRAAAIAVATPPRREPSRRAA